VVITFAGQKGGSGKSTTAICLAVELQARGSTVLLIDADAQGSVTTWREVALQRGHAAPDLIRPRDADDLMANVQEFAGRYEYVIVDLPSNLGAIPRAALMVSDLVLLPCTASAVEEWALTESVDLVQEARKLRPELRAFVVQARVQRGTTAARSQIG
jgi:chromosome partitioning protein